MRPLLPRKTGAARGRRGQPLFVALAIVAAVWVCGAPASAQTTYQWNGTLTTSATTPGNWSSNSVPVFGGGTASPTNARWQIYNGANNAMEYSAAQGWTVLAPSGGARAILIGNGSSGSMTITGGTLQLADTSGQNIVGNGSTGVLTVDGGTFLSGTQQLTFWPLSTGTATITVKSGSANIPNLTTGVNGGLGNVNADGGTLVLSSVAMSSGSTNFNFNGGTVVAGTSSTDFLSSNLRAFTNVRDGGAIIDTAGNTITLTQGLRHSAIGGDAAIDGGLRKQGAGTLVLAGLNTYTGTTTLNAGTLQIGGGGTTGVLATTSAITGSAGATLAFNRTDLIASGTHFNDVIGGSINVAQLGSGTVVLNGTNTYTGTTSALGGTLQIGGGGTTGSVSSSSVLALGGGSLVLNRSDAATQAFASTTLAPGASGISANATNTINLGAITQGAGATLNIATTGSVVTSSTNGNGILGGGITYGGTTWAVANGASAITGLSTFTTTSTAGTTAGNYTNANIDVTSSQSPSAAITPNSLRFNTAGAFTLTLPSAGNTLSSGGILVTSAVGNNASTITGGTIAGSSGGALTIVQNNTANSLTIASAIADNTSATGLTKSGAGTLQLTGANSYTGGTQINGGVLALGNAAALGTTGTIAFGGGTLRFSGSNTTDYSGRFSTASNQAYNIDTNGQTVTFASALASWGGTLTKSGSGTLSLQGNNSFTGNVTLTSATAGSVIEVTRSTSLGTGSKTVTMLGFGLGLVLNGTGGGFDLGSNISYAISNDGSQYSTPALRNVSGTNNILGTIAIGDGGAGLAVQSDAGLVRLQGAISIPSTFPRSIVLGGAANGVVSVTIPNGAQPTSLTKQGSGTWFLTGSSAYTGTTSVTGGVLFIGINVVGGTNAGAINGSSALVLGGGSVVLNRSDAFTQVFAGTTLTAGASSVSANATNTINLGAITQNSAATLNIAATGTFITSSANGANGILGGGITYGGTTWAVVSGSTIAGLSSYTTTTTAGNTAGSYANANIDVTSSPSPSTAIAPNSLRFHTAGATTLTLPSAGNTVSSGGILVTSTVGNNASTITGGTIAGSSGGALTVVQSNTANSLTIASAIADNTSATGLTKSGSGTLQLTGANTYTGTTQLNAGVLALGSAGALGTTGTISFGGGTLQFSSSNTTDYSGRFSTAGNQAYNIDVNGQTVTFASALSGTGSTLTKSGSGTLSLQGNNSFTGNVTLLLATGSAASVIEVTRSTSLGTGNKTVTAAGYGLGLALNATAGDITLGSNISFALGNDGSVSSTPALRNVAGANTISGSITITDGGAGFGVKSDAGLLTLAGNITTYSQAGLSRPAVLDGASNGVISGTISNGNTPALVTKQGSGTWTLTAANTYTGTTSVNAGTLQIGNGGTSGALATASVITGSAGATLAFNRTDTITSGTHFASAIGGGINVTQMGSGTLVLAGVNTYTGTTSITGAGMLQLTSSGTLSSTGAVNVAAAGARFDISGMTASGLAIGSLRSVASSTVALGTKTLTFGDATSGTIAGVIAGTGGIVKQGAGVVTFSGVNTYTGTTRVNAGTLQLGDGGSTGEISPSSVITGSAGATLAFNRSDTLTQGTHFATAIGGGLGLSKLGSGKVTLTSPNSYTGTTAISAGALEIGSAGSIGSTSSILISGSTAELKYNSATALDRSINLVQGTISGTGTIGSAVTFTAGDYLSPGNSPGTQAYTNLLKWDPAGTYRWELNALTGTAGTNWDFVDVTSGTFDLSGLSTAPGNQFVLDLVTLTAGNVAGPLAVPFDGGTYTLPIAGYNSGVGRFLLPTGFVNTAGADLTGLFTINLTNWQGTQPQIGNVSVKINSTATGLDLVIVPEPGAIALAGLGIMVAGWALRKRGRITP